MQFTPGVEFTDVSHDGEEFTVKSFVDYFIFIL